MFKKIIIHLLIITIIAPFLSVAPLNVDRLRAQTTGSSDTETNTKKTETETETTTYEDNTGTKATITTPKEKEKDLETGDYSEEMKSPCGPFFIRFGPQCIGYGLTWLVYTAFFMPSYFITYAAGSIFNASIGFSLTSEAFPSGENSMIATGWTIMRDLINLFFIFILLYIAISTILQYGSFGKDVIVKLIIAAVLINFSLMITKVIIDSSHVLAWNFYDKIDVRNMEKRGDKEIKADMPNDIEIKKFKIKNLASVFYAGFNPQRLIVPSNSGEEPMVTMYSHARQKGATIKDVWWKMLLIIILAVVLNLVAAFVLFAGAIMFILRVVVLWFVLILSPLAFAGMITPKFQKYSSQWWDKLISQAFFAPAFLFMFYLVTILVNDNFLQSIIIGASDSASASILGIDPSSTIVVFFHFIVVGGLLVGCLWIAQQMGAYGASGFMGAFDKGKKWTTDKIKRGAIGGIKHTAGYAGEYATREAGAFGEKIATKDGKLYKAMRWIPGMTKLGADLSAKNKTKINEIQKQYEKYSDKELENMMPTIAPRSFTRAAMVQELAKRKSLRNIPKETIGKAEKTLEAYGAKTKDIKSLQWQHASTATEKENAIKGVYDFDPVTRVGKWKVPKLNASVIEDVDIEKYFDKPVGDINHDPVTYGANSPIRKAMYETFHGGHIQNFMKRNDAKDITDRFFKNLETDFTSQMLNRAPGTPQIDDLITWVTDPAYGIENRQLASWFKSRAGEQLLKSYGWQ